MRRLIAACAAISVAVTLALDAVQQGGRTLPPWSPGVLDIHQISTGVGNSALLILPDGTSLLVDAGDLQTPDTARRPSDARRTGEWIARYARWALRHDANPSLDYALITHLHGDHMGAVTPDAPNSPNGYKLAGLSEVAESIAIGRVLDRGWPDYNYPAPVAGIEDYRRFLDWQQRNRGVRPERVVAGRDDQIRLIKDADRYPSFEIRNIVVNGDVWTGTGTMTRPQFPELSRLSAEDVPPENSCSAAIRLTYGPFSFFTGGDLTGAPAPGGPTWTDVETAIAPIVGAVDVAVLNHHGMGDATNETFLRALRPRVIVIPASYPQHPNFDTVARITSPRIYRGPRDIFATGVLPATRTAIGNRVDQFKSAQGHVVVRVAPGGQTYQVYVVDDASESREVKAVFAPYQSQ